jgi:hypothetical protein
MDLPAAAPVDLVACGTDRMILAATWRMPTGLHVENVLVSSRLVATRRPPGLVSLPIADARFSRTIGVPARRNAPLMKRPMTFARIAAFALAVALPCASLAQGDVFSSQGQRGSGGNTTRPTGKQAVQDDSVYCQQTPDGRVIPKPYGGTRQNIPCGPNFVRRPPLVPGSTPTDRVCNLRELAALVNERYGAGAPVATVRIANDTVPHSYLLMLQGMDNQDVQLKDAIQAYTREAHIPELRLLENFIRLGSGDAYRTTVLDAVGQLPDGAQVIVAGHSHGGMEAQNIVGALAGIRPDLRVTIAIAFGSPALPRQPGPRYLDVKAIKGVPDLVALPLLDRGVSTGIISIEGDSSLDLYDTEHGSHFVYWKSPQLERLWIDGRPVGSRHCLALDAGSMQSFPLASPGSGSKRWTPCPDVSFGAQPPDSVNDLFSGPAWAGWKARQSAAWRSATTLKQLNAVSEDVGEKGMEVKARALGYTPLLAPGSAGTAPQGFDGVYRAPDGAMVVAEAKGGYAGQGVDDILGYGYRCRQGTIEWARRAAERILTAGTTTAAEQRVAQELRSRILSRAPGFGVRVEVFHTEHVNGVAGATRRYVTGSTP